jgi:hypothetical protein
LVSRLFPAQFAAPNDGLFHTYRFVCNNTTGIGTLSLDGVVQGTYKIGAGVALSGSGAGNATIGLNMDGGGAGVAEMDKLIVQYPPILLPLDLLSFDSVAVFYDLQDAWDAVAVKVVQAVGGEGAF